METKKQIGDIMPIINALGIKPKLMYTKIETAEILGLSTQTLDRLKNRGIGLNYKKIKTDSKANNGRVMYPISEIARYYFDNVQSA